MNRLTAAVVMLLVVFAASCSSSEPTENGEATPAGGTVATGVPGVNEVAFYSGGHLIPGDGSEPIDGIAMIAENGIITRVGKLNEFYAPDGATRVDLEDDWIMPQLINAHGHAGVNNQATSSASNYSRDSVISDLRKYAYYGVGFVQLLGTDAGDEIYAIRDEINNGTLKGTTRIRTAGRGITARGGWPTQILGDIPYQVSNEAEARQAVGELADKKVDLVKIWVDDNMGTATKMSPAVYTAIIDEATKRNLKVVAHVFYLADAQGLVEAGVSGLVHSVRDREVDNGLIAMMKEKNVYYSPTLTAHEAKFIYADNPNWMGEQSMREVYPPAISAYFADNVTRNKYRRNPNAGALKDQYEMAKRNLKKMADAGVKIVLGTDSGSGDTFPGYFEHRELELMVDAGMSEVDAIKAGTAVAAEMLGLTDAGVLAVGKRADFLQLSANPLEDIAETRDIADVYTAGMEVDRTTQIQQITLETPRVTDQDRANDRQALAREVEQARIDRIPKYGKFPRGTAVPVSGMPIPTPLNSRASSSGGTLTVTMNGASAADMQGFYAAAFPAYSWTAQGNNCFGRMNNVTKKAATACVQASPNTARIEIRE